MRRLKRKRTSEPRLNLVMKFQMSQLALYL